MSTATSTTIKNSPKTLLAIEILSTVFSLVYTIAYIQGQSWCFLFGGLGALGFVLLCWVKRIYAESALQFFYVLFAIYGYLSAQDEWLILHHSLEQSLPFVLAGAAGTVLLGLIMKRFSDAASPFLDAFTTIYSLVATWLMVSFIHENWLYWIIINAVSSILYYRRKLYFGALLFVIYFFLAIYGYFNV